MTKGKKIGAAAGAVSGASWGSKVGTVLNGALYSTMSFFTCGENTLSYKLALTVAALGFGSSIGYLSGNYFGQQLGRSCGEIVGAKLGAEGKSDNIIQEKCTTEGKTAGIIAGVNVSLIATGLFFGPVLYLNNLNQDEESINLVGSLDENQIEEI
jgi:hypothetical protein